jgi:hypothetical protein
MKRFEVKHNDTIQVFRLDKTSNKKISQPGNKIVQTYTYSKKQYDYVKKCLENNEKPNFNKFFLLADTNCLDCIFSKLQKGGCYTHKVMQYSGFISQLKSIVNKYGNFDNLPTYESLKLPAGSFYKFFENKFIRFGTYGEPVLIPLNIVQYITKIAKNWTGYSHQWRNKKYIDYNQYFMASTHNIEQSLQAEKLGYRSFMVVNNKPQFTNLVNCPASKENNFKSNCEHCGLCSGISGKGKKSVYIFEH